MTEIEFLLRELLKTREALAAARIDDLKWPDPSVPDAPKVFWKANEAFNNALHAIFVYAEKHYGNDQLS